MKRIKILLAIALAGIALFTFTAIFGFYAKFFASTSIALLIIAFCESGAIYALFDEIKSLIEESSEE